MKILNFELKILKLPFSRYVVSGHSMQPLFNPGDKILINRWAYLFSSPKPGNIIAFHDQTQWGKIILKRIEKTSQNNYFVVGINKSDSRDSKKFGSISKTQIIGKVLTSY